MNIESQIKTSKLNSNKKAVISIIYTANFLMDEISAVLKPFDLSLQQFNVLRILKGRKDKPANLSFIQERMISKMSNTSRLVDKLIQKQLVQRTICEQNRRKVDIFITAKGKNLLNEVNEMVDRKEYEITSNLSVSQLNLISDLLNIIRE
jgi:DNA-binding MarR family transcriptional regulator